MEIKLYEDTLPKSLNVIFSSKINKEIIFIKNYNQNNTEALAKWYNYIEEIKKYVSNRSIAWDYADRIRTFRNGTKFIGDFNYNVGYTVKWNSHEAYVYIFMINLNPQEFGLKIPPTLKENKTIYTNTIMNTQNKQTVRLTETQLKRIINESVKQILTEDIFHPSWIQSEQMTRRDINKVIELCNNIKDRFDSVLDMEDDLETDEYSRKYTYCQIYDWASKISQSASKIIEVL